MAADGSSLPDATPATLGYRWPAEWETHHATWLSWPHNRATWPGRFETVEPEYARLALTLADAEPVHILAGGAEVMQSARRWVGDHPGVTLHPIATNDAWIRDHGPTFIAPTDDQPPAMVDWDYNAWGGKYPPYDLDNQVPTRLAGELGLRRFVPGAVLEGGAIEGNGAGLVLTTRSCLLNPNRNGPVQAEQIETLLRAYLAAEKVLWLAAGHLAGDDTDGHIDQLARFVAPRTLVAAVADSSDEEHHAALHASLAELRAMTDQQGRPLEVVRLPLPRARYCQGHRLPASYANFYVANGLVVVPAFDDPADARAAAILAEHFPDRQVVSLPAGNLVWGLGAFHCLTQQQPAMHAGGSCFVST